VSLRTPFSFTASTDTIIFLFIHIPEGDLVQDENELSSILSVINERQQVSYEELSDALKGMGIDTSELTQALLTLESRKLVASRSSGGIMMYYMLQQEAPRNVLIVEDDRNISKLMALSIGKDFAITQVYDGAEAMSEIKKSKPDLVVLDLMLPNKDGLEICQEIKSNSALAKTIVILVSAMDPTSNRFKGIKYGADYYIKKPFDPQEMRGLVTIFLKKKGKRFDPLIDLPSEARISEEVERSLSGTTRNTIGTLHIEHLDDYARRLSAGSAMFIIRLVSQLMQDIIKDKSIFLGFLNSDSFVVAGVREDVNAAMEELRREFSAILPFVLQDEGYKPISLDLDGMFDANEIPRLALDYKESSIDAIKQRRDEILRDRGARTKEIGSYTYDELRRLFAGDRFDVKITRDSSGVRLQVGKQNPEEGQQ
jgi:CheY-like chemotaxis protein